MSRPNVPPASPIQLFLNEPLGSSWRAAAGVSTAYEKSGPDARALACAMFDRATFSIFVR
jgi:hypothetical protein